jgi:hypothetical protein
MRCSLSLPACPLLDLPDDQFHQLRFRHHVEHCGLCCREAVLPYDVAELVGRQRRQLRAQELRTLCVDVERIEDGVCGSRGRRGPVRGPGSAAAVRGGPRRGGRGRRRVDTTREFLLSAQQRTVEVGVGQAGRPIEQRVPRRLCRLPPTDQRLSAAERQELQPALPDAVLAFASTRTNAVGLAVLRPEAPSGTRSTSPSSCPPLWGPRPERVQEARMQQGG